MTPPAAPYAHDGSVYTYDYYVRTCGGVNCQFACRTRYQYTCETDCL